MFVHFADAQATIYGSIFDQGGLDLEKLKEFRERFAKCAAAAIYCVDETST